MRLGELLVLQGLVSQAQVDECARIGDRLRAAGVPRPLGSLLVERGYITFPVLEKAARLLPPSEKHDAQVAAAGIAPVPLPLPVPRPAPPSAPHPLSPRPAPSPATFPPSPPPAPAHAPARPPSFPPAPSRASQATVTDLPAFAAPGPQATITEMPAFAGVDLEAETPLPAAAPPPTAPAPSPPSREGTRRALPSLPGYELEKKLGEGQMGAVYKGRETASGRTVAVKLLPPHLAANREYIARFDREAQAAMRLQHPNIVQGIACGEAGGFHYFVMEFVEGESLEARIKRDRKVPERDALEVALGVAAALECAAREGIVHRDLKPANILVGTGGQVKVVDLGLAKNVDDEKKQQPALTRVGIILGSPYYLAPEQAATQKVDARSDLYSLGATLYHLVTGSVPFDGQDPIEILENLLSSPPPDPRRRAPDLSEAFSRAITKLMAKRPDARFQTPTELRLELLRIREDSSRGGTLRWIKRLLTGR